MPAVGHGHGRDFPLSQGHDVCVSLVLLDHCPPTCCTPPPPLHTTEFGLVCGDSLRVEMGAGGEGFRTQEFP